MTKTAIPAAPMRNATQAPDNYLPGVVIALLLFWPLGLVALHHSRRVHQRWNTGDSEGARQSSLAARCWCIRAAMLPVLIFVLFVVGWGLFGLFHSFETGWN